MIIYQVLTRLFRDGKFSDFDASAFEHFRSLGVTHVWYTGIPAHSTDKPYVKGIPGSPYSITDYYDVNPYFAVNPDKRIEEFRDLVQRTHAAGLKVMIDFVPNHVSPDYSDAHGGIETFPYCDYDWTDTRKINYSVRQNWDRLLNILLYWCSLGVDGFRCDMAELVDVEFFRFLTGSVKAQYPSTIFVAEVYNKDNYRRYIETGGFDLLYDKSGTYDILRAITEGNCGTWALTASWQSLSDLQGRMLNFLENHDEQRLPFWAPHYALASLAWAALFNNASFMLYFGQEAGLAASEAHDARTSIFNWIPGIDPTRDVLTPHGSFLFGRYKEVLSLCARLQSDCARNWDLAYLQSSEWSSRSLAAFLRFTDQYAYLVLCNFSGQDVCETVAMPSELGLGQSYTVHCSANDYKILKIK